MPRDQRHTSAKQETSSQSARRQRPAKTHERKDRSTVLASLNDDPADETACADATTKKPKRKPRAVLAKINGPRTR